MRRRPSVGGGRRQSALLRKPDVDPRDVQRVPGGGPGRTGPLPGTRTCSRMPTRPTSARSTASTRNDQHGTINTERSTRNDQHGTINTERSTRNNQHGTIKGDPPWTVLNQLDSTPTSGWPSCSRPGTNPSSITAVTRSLVRWPPGGSASNRSTYSPCPEPSRSLCTPNGWPTVGVTPPSSARPWLSTGASTGTSLWPRL